MLAMLISGIWHELGHAMAAAAFQIPMLTSGLFFFVVFPGAFVELDTARLLRLGPWQQLSVASSGVLNNLLLVLASNHVLVHLPWYLEWLGYSVSTSGPVFLDSHRGLGLERGYLIKAVNDQPIVELAGLRAMMYSMDSSRMAGPFRCIDAKKWGHFNQDCCMSRSINKSGVECLWDVTSLELVAGLTDLSLSGMNIVPKNYLGFDREAFLASDNRACSSDLDCSSGDQSETCMGPYTYGRERLVHLELHPLWDFSLESHPVHSPRPGPLNVSLVVEPKKLMDDGRDRLLTLVLVGTFLPRHPLLPLQIPFLVESLFRYLFSLNVGLFLINMMPCFVLDGRQAIDLFPSICLQRGWTPGAVAHLKTLLKIYTRLSECLIVLVVLLAII
ncbi:Membrane-bound transcription factor site-2 protease [Kappamyces sp. JEL0829]|nr:Membrane-bound transcription factor site-2 protease [Kappamyces sp. JEL0829]